MRKRIQVLLAGGREAKGKAMTSAGAGASYKQAVNLLQTVQRLAGRWARARQKPGANDQRGVDRR
jgi:hypothetical protein